MSQLNQRDKLGIGAAVSAVLVLGMGGYIYQNHGASGFPNSSVPALAPAGADGRPAASSLDIPATAGPPSNTPPSSQASSTLYVHVVGAVRNPGVYQLHPGDRIVSAVHAAGGFRPDASEDAVNLADVARDADQIYIPRRDEVQRDNRAVAPLQIAQTLPAESHRQRHARQEAVVPGTLSPPRPITPLSPGASQADSSNSTPPTRIIGRTIGRPAPIPSATLERMWPLPESTAGSATASATGSIPVEAGVTNNQTSLVPQFGSPEIKANSKVPSFTKSTAPRKYTTPGAGVVHLNTATAEELAHVPGIGAGTAARIVGYRTDVGAFTTINQLLQIRGIGAKTFEKMKPFVAP